MALPSFLSEPTSRADQQWLFSQEQIDNSPSVKGGIPRKMEVHYRALAVRRLFAYKDHLGLPQLVVNTAAAYMHRFYMRKRMQSNPWDMIAAAAIFLAAKVEESQRRLRDVVSVTLDLDADKEPLRESTHAAKLIVDETRSMFHETRKRILYFEEVMNQTLCFDLTIRQPQFVLIKGSHIVWKDEQAEVAKKVAQVGWAFINDSLYTTLQLLHRPNVIAAAALVLACSQLGVPVAGIQEAIDPLLRELAREEGEEPEVEVYWLELFNVAPEEVQDAVERMVKGYERAQNNYVRREAERTGQDAIAAALLLEPVPALAPPPPSAADPLLPYNAPAEPTPPTASSSTIPLSSIPIPPSQPAPPALADPPAVADPPAAPTPALLPSDLPPPPITFSPPPALPTKMDIDPPEMPPPSLPVPPSPAPTKATDMDVGETTDAEASFPVGMSGGRSLLSEDTEMESQSYVMDTQPFAFPSSQGSQQG